MQSNHALHVMESDANIDIMKEDDRTNVALKSN